MNIRVPALALLIVGCAWSQPQDKPVKPEPPKIKVAVQYRRLTDGDSKLAFGKFNWYDALAPEFDTYATIKELARKKAEGDKP